MRRIIGQVALLALLFNASVQVECCTSVFGSSTGQHQLTQIKSSLCMEGEEAGHDDRMAAFEAWAQSAWLGGGEHKSHDHDGEDCTCIDGACSAGSVLPGSDYVAFVYGQSPENSFEAAETQWSIRPILSAVSPRGPPRILL